VIASNAQIVERILDSWRQLESIPPELMQSDVEWVNPPDAIETGTRHGRDGFQEAQSAFRRAYSSMEIHVERQVERGDAVGLIVESVLHGRGSGIEVRQRQGMLFTIRQGKVARFEWSNQPENLLSGLLG
jgi:ketosteroid isomerase-like protein